MLALRRAPCPLALLCTQSLLTDPNCESPANGEAAQLYVQDRAEYNRRIRRIAQRSADGC
jgi:ubiquitin-conjugating enzyme E2 A